MKGRKISRVRIGRSWFVPVLLKVVSTNPDGSPRWLEICKDDEMLNIADGTRQFYMVWGSETLARRAGQSGDNTGSSTTEQAALGDIKRAMLDKGTARADEVTITEKDAPAELEGHTEIDP